MPATLKSLTEGSKPLVVAYEDDPKAVTVWTSKLTPKIERLLGSLSESDGDKAYEHMVPLFLALITKWDLKTEKGGEIVPLTEEAIEIIPYDFQMAIIDAFMAEHSPKPPTEEPSSDA